MPTDGADGKAPWLAALYASTALRIPTLYD